MHDREIETAIAVAACVYAGADAVRVHDVETQARAVHMALQARRSLLARGQHVSS